MPYTGNVRRQTGSAAYTGGATGVYRLNGGTAVTGRFTADVAINVSFGLNTEAASLQFGMSNIATRTSAGTADGPAVDDTGSRALIAEAAGSSFTGTGSFGGARWGGRFFGPSGAQSDRHRGVVHEAARRSQEQHKLCGPARRLRGEEVAAAMDPPTLDARLIAGRLDLPLQGGGDPIRPIPSPLRGGGSGRGGASGRTPPPPSTPGCRRPSRPPPPGGR